MRLGLGEYIAVRSLSFSREGDWGENRGRDDEDSLILLSPPMYSDLLGGMSTVARRPPFWGVLAWGVQTCCEGVGVGVGRVAALGTLVISNHPLMTPSFVTVASSNASPWILLRASPNPSTTFEALITLPSIAEAKSLPVAGDRRMRGGNGVWSTSRPTPERIVRIPRIFRSNSSLS